MTNREYLNSLSDEELAGILERICLAGYDSDCAGCLLHQEECGNGGFLNWLKAERKEKKCETMVQGNQDR